MGANINPTFYGEGHTPVNHNSAEIILQKILGAIIDNGSIQSGPSAATQPQVDACSSATTYVSPLTLCNWQLPYGFTKQGTTANTQSNWEPITTKKIYVNGTYGNDTRTGLSKYNRDVPFKTIAAALAAWFLGDTIWIMAGTYAEKNLTLLDGLVVYYEPNTFHSVSASATATDCLWVDITGGNPAYILGYGTFSMVNTGANVEISCFKITQLTSIVTIECISATCTKAGGDAMAFRLLGGTHYIKARNITASGNAVAQSVSSAILTYVDVVTASSNSQTFLAGSGGTLYVKAQKITGTGDAFACQNSSVMAFDVNEINISGDIFVSATGTCVGRFIKGTTTTWGIDATGGDMDITFGTLTCTQVGINLRAGAGNLNVRGQLLTAPILIKGKLAANANIDIQQGVGNDATGAIQTITGSDACQFSISGHYLNNDATAPVISYLGSNKLIIINSNTVLVSQAGSTNCIAGTAANVYNVYGAPVANKIADAGLVPQVSAIVVSALVK